NQLCAARNGRGERRSGRIEDPEAIGWVDNDALNAVQRLARMGGIELVDRDVGIGDDRAIPSLSDRERYLVAPTRKVDEDASLSCRDAARAPARHTTDNPTSARAATRPASATAAAIAMATAAKSNCRRL